MWKSVGLRLSQFHNYTARNLLRLLMFFTLSRYIFFSSHCRLGSQISVTLFPISLCSVSVEWMDKKKCITQIILLENKQIPKYSENRTRHLWYPNHLFHFLKDIKYLTWEKNKSVMEVQTDSRASREEADKMDSSEMTNAIVILVSLSIQLKMILRAAPVHLFGGLPSFSHWERAPLLTGWPVSEKRLACKLE